jgi:adenine/guanine/hypoxanthine permease
MRRISPGAVVGAALGSPFPPAVYIGHPGWKEAGGRTTYSLASGVVIALMCFFGLLGALIPLPAIVPILLYIGLLIGAQAFVSVPKAHAAAVVLAVIPNVAAWATGQIDNVLNAAGTSATKVGTDALAKAGVVYDGLKSLGDGAILAGMLLGAIAAFVIDKRYYWAAGYCVAGAALSFIGLIHGEQVAWAASPGVALGHLFAAVVCLTFSLGSTPALAQMPDEHPSAPATIPEPPAPARSPPSRPGDRDTGVHRSRSQPAGDRGGGSSGVRTI